MLPASQLLNLPSSSSSSYQHHIDILLHVKSKLVGLCLVGSGNNFRAKCQKKISQRLTPWKDRAGLLLYAFLAKWFSKNLKCIEVNQNDVKYNSK